MNNYVTIRKNEITQQVKFLKKELKDFAIVHRYDIPPKTDAVMDGADSSENAVKTSIPSLVDFVSERVMKEEIGNEKDDVLHLCPIRKNSEPRQALYTFLCMMHRIWSIV